MFDVALPAVMLLIILSARSATDVVFCLQKRKRAGRTGDRPIMKTSIESEVPPLPQLTGENRGDASPRKAPPEWYVLATVVSVGTFSGVFVGLANVVHRITYGNTSVGSFLALFLMVIGVVPAWLAAGAVGRVILRRGAVVGAPRDETGASEE